MISLAAAERRTVTVRPALPSDQAFVGATMSEQLQRGGCTDGNAITDRVLDSSRCRVLIASDPASDRILGWLAYVPMPRVRAVLFLYVRRHDRTQHVARQLVDAAWPARSGQWVHAGLVGASTKSLLQRYPSVEMTLDELL